MPDERDRKLLRYLSQQETEEARAQQQVQSDTGRFPLVERPAAFYPVPRPYCEQHSGVCVEIVRLREDVAALRADKGSIRARWFSLVASFLGGGGGAVLAYLLSR